MPRVQGESKMEQPRFSRGKKVKRFIVLLLLVSLILSVALGIAWYSGLQQILIPLAGCPHVFC